MAEARRKFDRGSWEGAVRLMLFKPRTQPVIERITDLMCSDLHTRLAERRITLDLTEDARRSICQIASEHARPAVLVQRRTA
jgi:ATP-dependent Clp protease ATP-binding subunit ClpB